MCRYLRCPFKYFRLHILLSFRHQRRSHKPPLMYEIYCAEGNLQRWRCR
ncbi:unnamed protein product [Brassica rapa]|uniref:Uncharacterized protein n=1 Tax=Brassica campestris TaxID=3711 RepID=A0A8D9CME2_BRACM|nr:unnamed protein product [Brassica rapa]